MTDRILDISETGANLSVKNRQLTIWRGDDIPEVSTPFSELAALVVSNRAVRYSHTVLQQMAEHNAVLIVCDEKHLPTAMMLPIAKHSTQAERMTRQAEAPVPVKKRIWQQLIKAKIGGQAAVLRFQSGENDDGGLDALAKKVRSGDPDNIEGQAARRYWPLVFNDPDFRRRPEADGLNSLLNYGYAILRGVVAWAICGSGLHPSLGVHHHNRYDAFCLANDLMEPFRPLVDLAVIKCITLWGTDITLNRDSKKVLLESLTGLMELDGEQRTLFDSLTRVCASLAKAFEGKRKSLLLPQLFPKGGMPEP